MVKRKKNPGKLSRIRDPILLEKTRILMTSLLHRRGVQGEATDTQTIEQGLLALVDQIEGRYIPIASANSIIEKRSQAIATSLLGAFVQKLRPDLDGEEYYVRFYPDGKISLAFGDEELILVDLQKHEITASKEIIDHDFKTKN